GLFHCDGGGLVLRNERLHPLEDRLEAQLRALPRGRLPPPVVECPDTASAFLDDPVSASSRPRIDAQNLHEERLGGAPDVPAFAGADRHPQKRMPIAQIPEGAARGPAPLCERSSLPR